MDYTPDEYLDYERFDRFLYLLDCNVYIEPAFEEAMACITESEWDDMYEEERKNGFYVEEVDSYYSERDGDSFFCVRE